MKKFVALTILMLMTFTGCSDNEDSQVLQQLSDNTQNTKAYTDDLFKEHLAQQGITDYKITLTSSGFSTGDPLTYYVVYEYTHDDVSESYGYEVSMNDNTFVLVDEGADITVYTIGVED